MAWYRPRRKNLGSIVGGALGGVGGAFVGKKIFDDPLAAAKSEKEAAQAALAGQPEEQARAQLGSELKSYGNIDKTALEQATEASKRAGTYAPTREFQTGLAGEAGAEARGIRGVSLARINALKQRLGIPIAPGGTV